MEQPGERTQADEPPTEAGARIGPAIHRYVTRICGPEAADQLTDQVIVALAEQGAGAGVSDPAAVIQAARQAVVDQLELHASRLGRRLSLGRCHMTPRMLAERSEGVASAKELERHYDHLRTCSNCGDLAARYTGAEWGLRADLAPPPAQPEGGAEPEPARNNGSIVVGKPESEPTGAGEAGAELALDGAGEQAEGKPDDRAAAAPEEAITGEPVDRAAPAPRARAAFGRDLVGSAAEPVETESGLAAAARAAQAAELDVAAEAARAAGAARLAAADDEARAALVTELAAAAKEARRRLEAELAADAERAAAARARAAEEARAAHAAERVKAAEAARIAHAARLAASDEQARAELVAELASATAEAERLLAAELAAAAQEARAAWARSVAAARAERASQLAGGNEAARAEQVPALGRGSDAGQAPPNRATKWIPKFDPVRGELATTARGSEVIPVVKSSQEQPERADVHAAKGRSTLVVFLLLVFRRYLKGRSDGPGGDRGRT